jgi:hypothetical protein
MEEKGVYSLKAGVKHEIVVDFVNVRGPADGDENELLIDAYVSLKPSDNNGSSLLLAMLVFAWVVLRSRIPSKRCRKPSVLPKRLMPSLPSWA